MARIDPFHNIQPRQLSLVHQPTVDVPPPTARPIAALSPLERALVDRDLATVKSMLQDGADPHLVCPVRLRAAAESDANGTACARLIQVAVRMKRMNLGVPPSSAGGTPVPGSLHASDARTGPLSRLLGRFSAGNSPKTAPRPHGPIMHALVEYDIGTATQALEAAGARPRKFVLKRDQDRLIGMLALNDTKALDAWHEKGLLQPSAQPADANGVKTALKQFSHRKLTPGRRKVAFLNGTVKFQNTREKIVCRHLAVYWLLHRPLLENGKIDYASLGSKKNLKKAFANENRNAIDYYTNNCTNTHLVENDKWGKFLATQFQEMQYTGAGAQPKRILISSDIHAMACELTIKKNIDGPSTYAVDFYDPNFTDSHRKVRTQDLSMIESISMAKLINNKSLVNLYYKNQSLSMAFVIPEQMPKTVSADTPFEFWRFKRADINGGETIANRQLSSRPAAEPPHVSSSGSAAENAETTSPVNANHVYHLISEGFDGELPRVFSEIAKMPDASKQANVLSASSSQGVPPLVVAMSRGHANTVAAYASGVLGLEGLSGDQKTTILLQHGSGRRMSKKSGLQWALKDNQADVVRNFTRIVLASEALSPDQKSQVLNTRSNNKDFLRSNATWVHSDAARAYIDAVMQSSLPLEVRGRLLQGIVN